MGTMSEIQHWEIDQNFIDTCKENIDLILDNKDTINPIKLKSFSAFKDFEDQWWDEFYISSLSKKIKINDDTQELFKFRYLERSDINVLDSIVDNIANNIFSNSHITMWLSSGEVDNGTDWHKDHLRNDPCYIFCINFIGTTKWEFETGEEIIMYPGDTLWQCGATAHKVTPVNGKPRVTCAIYNTANNFIS